VLRFAALVIVAAGWGFFSASGQDKKQQSPAPASQNEGYEQVLVMPTAKDNDSWDKALDEIFVRDGVPCNIGRLAAWQGRDRCGLNCVYALLARSGKPVSYEALERRAGPIPKGGLSFAQMQELAEECGLECKIIEGSVTELGKLPPPAIVHLGNVDHSGHFVCYIANNNVSLTFLDGSSGGTFEAGISSGRSLDAMSRIASGFILVPAMSGSGTLRTHVKDLIMYFSICLVGLSLLIWLSTGLLYWQLKQLSLQGQRELPSLLIEETAQQRVRSGD